VTVLFTQLPPNQNFAVSMSAWIVFRSLTNFFLSLKN